MGECLLLMLECITVESYVFVCELVLLFCFALTCHVAILFHTVEKCALRKVSVSFEFESFALLYIFVL